MMELVYLIISLISLLIKDIETVLLKKVNVNSFEHEKILCVSEEPSLLQCAQRCRFIDKNAIVDYKNMKCTCIKYETEKGQEHRGTLTGVFVNQKIMKAETIKPVLTTQPTKTTKPPQTQVINVALYKSAQQSSSFSENYDAKFAIDGSMSTLSSTKKEIDQWWSVDLQKVTDIVYMIIKGDTNEHNKALIVETRQNAYEGWVRCRNLGDLKSSPYRFTCDDSTNARYVKIRSTVECKIDMYEFQVYGRVTA